MQPVSPHCSGLRPWKDWHHTWRVSFGSACQSTGGGVWLGAWSHLCHCFSGLSVPLGSRYCGYDQRYASGKGCCNTCGQFFHSKPWPLLYHCVSLWLRFLVLLIYRCALLCFQSHNDRGILCQGKLRSSFTYLCRSRKTFKTLWGVLDLLSLHLCSLGKQSKTHM